MQLKFFTIPILSISDFNDELNTFLRVHKIVEVEKQLIQNASGTYWCICVTFLNQTIAEKAPKGKIDYMKELDAETFAKFSRLRQIRKEMAATDSVSAFVVFTDAELAEISKLDELSPSKLRTIPGIGQAKLEKYGVRLIEKYNLLSNETDRQPDTANSQ
ncbi:MAG: ATP-dependent DNA helicase RecQ [Bacteroidetes bacterium ADurb.Bin408]|nr:MAG: ATP-dependent DNA helicase RecQ [Bacteroidetes bacterium ADurb.Bin408]